MQGIDGLILVAPAIVAPIFRTSRAASNSGRCQKDGNAMSASFEGPEIAQESNKRLACLTRATHQTVGIVRHPGSFPHVL